jgi:hypothetical protein
MLNEFACFEGMHESEIDEMMPSSGPSGASSESSLPRYSPCTHRAAERLSTRASLHDMIAKNLLRRRNLLRRE